MTKHSPIKIVALLATVAAFWIVGPVSLANAADPTKHQYGHPIQQVAAGIGGDDDPTPPAGLQKKVVGGLPFTGLDVVALFAVAVALTSMGFALRRITAGRHVS